MIPLNIFQTWHTNNLPYKMKENINLLIKQNPEFKHYIFDIKKCREFIRIHFDHKVLDAYDNLIPFAYKADLWRYCVLYIKGGIYIDVKFKCINNFKLIDLIDNEYFCLDKNPEFIFNAFMICYPKNKILKNCIDKIVNNVKYNYYGFSALHPTGPALLGEIYYKYHINKNIELYHHISGKYILYNNKKILEMYNEYRKEQNHNTKNPYYAKLWTDGLIYKNHKQEKSLLWYRKIIYQLFLFSNNIINNFYINNL